MTLFKLDPRLGDPDLEVWRSDARTIYRKVSRRLAISNRSGAKVDKIRIVNRRRRPVRVYVDAYVDPRARALNSRYVLSVRRVR